MAFVNEESDIIIKATNRKTWQTVDHERNIILRKIHGPERDSSEYSFELFINGEEIRFAGTSGMKINNGVKKVGEVYPYDMNWHIYRLYTPDHLQNRKAEILKTIEESLKAWGWNYRTDLAHQVNVKFDPLILKDDVGNWGIVSPRRRGE